MRRVLVLLTCCTAMVAFSGCAQCQSPYDYCYSARGGICACDGHRFGRVGSLGPGTSPTVPAVDVEHEDSDLESIELPPPE